MSFILFLGLTFLGFYIVEAQIRPTIIDIAHMETQKIGTSVIEYAVRQSQNEVNVDKVLNYELDGNGNLIYHYFDTKIYNDMLTSLISNSQTYIQLLEEGSLPEELETIPQESHDSVNEIGLLYSIPLGQATGNSLLANLGPKIPIQLTAIADINIHINEEIKSLGINNTFLRLAIDFEVNAQIIIPFTTISDPVKTTIPIGFAFFPGEVPQFYSGNSNGVMPSLPLPIEEQLEEETAQPSDSNN
ncbi:sporulation protein YunB [Alkalihalobacillus alcalophilus]|uniref:sporulation protein YunB n=1 Tax=Alkalihalobacillus alcalophilus TaxID=1445 RepID=UPI0009DFFBEF|nr:sporulation protein YunB [Alkalihalobacillus alcalophilus]